MAGYSGTPLAKKLGIKEGFKVLTIQAPAEYQALLAPVPQSVEFTGTANRSTNLAHVFATKRTVLTRWLPALRKRLSPEAAVWVSWPKKSSNLATDITEDTIRAVALPLGFVDIKVCAVTEVWSGLKLVVRKELRLQKSK
jgi:hypothetical protein